MIAYLRGTVIEKTSDGAVIDVSGVGYAVYLTAWDQRGLPEEGRQVQLHVHMHAVSDGAPQLFGFSDREGRQLFETLLSVQGVGPRVAMAVLSGLPAAELIKAIAGSDVARLTQVRGVGRKTAERLVMELRDKVAALVGAGRSGARPGAGTAIPPVGIAPQGRLGDVYGALLSLGYRPVEIEPVLTGLDAAEPTETSIKKALAALRRK